MILMSSSYKLTRKIIILFNNPHLAVYLISFRILAFYCFLDIILIIIVFINGIHPALGDGIGTFILIYNTIAFNFEFRIAGSAMLIESLPSTIHKHTDIFLRNDLTNSNSGFQGYVGLVYVGINI